MQQGARASPPTSVEQSPSMGAQKRKLKQATDVVKASFPMMDVDASGLIYSGGVEVARYDLATEQWLQRGAWAGVGVRWEYCLATTSV